MTCTGNDPLCLPHAALAITIPDINQLWRGIQYIITVVLSTSGPFGIIHILSSSYL